MIKKLRIKFIIAAMVAISAVLFAIIAGVNIRNYVEINENADKTLNVIVENGGIFPSFFLDNNKGKKPLEFSPEAQYQTRYFTVTLDSSGNTSSINIDKIAAINTSEAENYAVELFKKNKTQGYIDDYRYVGIWVNDEYITYTFLDCSKELDTFRTFLLSSLLISVAGLLAIFVLVYVLSGIAVKPLAESLKKQKQFITDANHELKTPLTVIQASCDVLELDGTNEWTDVIKTQVERLTYLTNQLVFLSRTDEENAQATMTDFSLTEVCEEIFKSFEAVFVSQNKSFESNIAQNISFKGDVALIKELLSILMENASKYSNTEGRIEFSLAHNGKKSVLELSNTTEGVPKGNLSMLFERFYRLDSSRNSNTGGHGIGLSIAQAIVKLHNGKITAHSEDGVKIIFTVLL